MPHELRTVIPLPKNDLLPPPHLFAQRSRLHGRLHVGRVMVHGFLLLDATDNEDLEIPLWAAIYVHDLARKHDGFCQEHGEWALEKLRQSQEIRELFTRACFPAKHSRALDTAVASHCKMVELDRGHPHYLLTSLLKDADGLDRVRLGDLNKNYLRHPQSHALIPLAEKLFIFSDEQLDPDDPKLMTKLWDAANRLLAENA